MQAQTTGHLREYRFNRGILIALAGIGLLIASLVGIRALTDGQGVSQTPALSPVAAPVVEDPPLPDGWVDPYFNRAVPASVEEAPLRTDGWADPYVDQDAAAYPGTTAGRNSTTLSRAANSTIGFTAEGLDSTTLSRAANSAIGFTAGGVNSTTLNLDRNGADVFPASVIDSGTTNPAQTDVDRAIDPYFEQSATGHSGTTTGVNTTTLNLDRDGADIFTVSESPSTRLDRAAAIEDGMGFAEERSAADMVPRSTAEMHFIEMNVWDYAPGAQPAGNAAAPMSAADYRFIEENTWGDSPALPPAGELGQLAY